jgi:precorrin-6B methylase 2
MSEVTVRASGALFERAVTALDSALDRAPAEDISWVRPLPADDGWSLAPDALRLLVSLVTELSPRHVLEFGSGVSTSVIARVCAGLEPQGAVTSIDNDPKFAAATRRRLAGLGLERVVNLQVASLVARHQFGRLVPVYLLRHEELATRSRPEIVLVDGPPLVLGGREGVLVQAVQRARVGSIILVDDASRRAEAAALERLRGVLGEAIEVRALPGFVKGLAAIIVRKRPPVLREARTSPHRAHRAANPASSPEFG